MGVLTGVSEHVGIRWSGRERCVWALGGVEGCSDRYVRMWTFGGEVRQNVWGIRWSGKEKCIMYKVHQAVQDQYKIGCLQHKSL